MACPVPGPNSAFLSGMLAHFDCQAQSIGAEGYAMLASPGSPTSILLTAFLTLFVAVFGVRMLLGSVPSIGDATIAALKIGIVLSIATSWPAVRTLAYDTVLTGPAEIVAAIDGAQTLPGASGGLVGRLQAADNAIVAFTVFGSGRFDTNATAAPAASLPGRVPLSDDLAFSGARLAYLGSVLASFGLVRLAGGLLLALAPLFAGLLLFEATRGIFAGWLRMLVGIALAAIAVTIVASVELAILEPWLTNVLALRSAAYATPSAPIELLLIAVVFALIQIGIIAIALRVAFGQARRAWPDLRADRSPPDAQPAGATLIGGSSTTVNAEAMSRATMISNAVLAQQRRETQTTAAAPLASTVLRTGAASDAREGRLSAIVPIGQAQRRVRGRVSAAATRRSAMP